MDFTVNKEIAAYTNAPKFLERLKERSEYRELWSGHEFTLNQKFGEGLTQAFVRDNMHFYRMNWQFNEQVNSIFLPEPEDENYIDFCISKKGTVRSILLAKRNGSVFNNTEGNILQIFIKRDILTAEGEDLKKKLRINPLFSSIQKPLRDILETPPGGNRNALKLESKFLEFIHNYLDFLQEPLEERPSFMNSYVIAQLKDIRSFLLDNYIQSPDIKTLSRKFGINKDYLILGFRELYNTSPHKFIINLRLERAKELLITTDMPLKSVAAEVGYVNYGHFIKLYLKKFGVIPSEERLRMTK